MDTSDERRQFVTQKWSELQDLAKLTTNFHDDIMNENEIAVGIIKQMRLDLEREKDISRSYQKRCQNLEKWQEDIESNRFVLVLLDGDCMHFQDHLVQELELGGEQAATQLKISVKRHVEECLPKLRLNLKIVIRIYLNLRGLGKTYYDAKILDTPTDFERFVRGFNKSCPLSDIVDAGNGKECSDQKIRCQLELNMNDIHCKHILFGGSADNGYARMLGPFSGNTADSNRITLIEGPPMARELAAIAPRFAVTDLDSLFRATKLLVRKVSFPSTPPKSPAQPTWALAIQHRDTSTSGTPTSPKVEETKKVYANAKGQRIDVPLKPSSALVHELKLRKLCNLHHLSGFCYYQNCKHEHGPRLEPKRLEALRFLARLTPCQAGVFCEDEDCIYGHRCPQTGCTGTPDCRFSREMHGVSTIIVK
ncbi:MAG: hypothetical protein M4579_003060 [Chaenotheca gracillima]|nr:MAG: hypothetical protein M4579_003060 [Chaenotheca gracillima]